MPTSRAVRPRFTEHHPNTPLTSSLTRWGPPPFTSHEPTPTTYHIQLTSCAGRACGRHPSTQAVEHGSELLFVPGAVPGVHEAHDAMLIHHEGGRHGGRLVGSRDDLALVPDDGEAHPRLLDEPRDPARLLVHAHAEEHRVRLALARHLLVGGERVATGVAPRRPKVDDEELVPAIARAEARVPLRVTDARQVEVRSRGAEQRVLGARRRRRGAPGGLTATERGRRESHGGKEEETGLHGFAGLHITSWALHRGNHPRPRTR